jgi:methylthioribose-1-phosphate isomerase
MAIESLRPVFWKDDTVMMLDQRVLPNKEVYLELTTPKQVVNAIKNMAIRGAPAVGVAGAMALALGAMQVQAADPQTFRRKFVRVCEQVRSARPTGYNLTWAVDRVYSVVADHPEADVPTLQRLIREEVDKIIEEDVESCKNIGRHGKEVIPKGAKVLTYCNAGALATADYGTALGVIRAAHEADPNIQVYSCETRPFLQGCRLTTYELMHDNIPVTLITDNAVGTLMQHGEIDAVVVGADRIASNGDAANKIGTYMVAVLAHTHDVPFYVAAPRSTIDPEIPDGSQIPIEERNPREVTHWGTRCIAPEGVNVYNPAFDVTPNKYIAGIVTEVGVLKKPYKTTIAKALKE